MQAQLQDSLIHDVFAQCVGQLTRCRFHNRSSSMIFRYTVQKQDNRAPHRTQERCLYWLIQIKTKVWLSLMGWNTSGMSGIGDRTGSQRPAVLICFLDFWEGYCFLPDYPVKNTFLDPLESGYPDFSQGPSEPIGGMHVIMISKSLKGFTLFCTWNLALNFSHTFLVIKSHLYMV